MYSNNPDGSPLLGSIIIDNEDFLNECVANPMTLCYTQQTFKNQVAVSARIHCCMAARTSQVPELSGSNRVTCDSLSDFVDYEMFTLSAALLHEYTHFDAIGGVSLPTKAGFPNHIGDMGFNTYDTQPKGYGPWATRILDKQLATRNADSYAWLALENYWTSTCTDRTGFTGPRDSGDNKTPSWCGGTPENQDTAYCVIQ